MQTKATLLPDLNPMSSDQEKHFVNDILSGVDNLLLVFYYGYIFNGVSSLAMSDENVPLSFAKILNNKVPASASNAYLTPKMDLTPDAIKIIQEALDYMCKKEYLVPMYPKMIDKKTGQDDFSRNIYTRYCLTSKGLNRAEVLNSLMHGEGIFSGTPL